VLAAAAALVLVAVAMRLLVLVGFSHPHPPEGADSAQSPRQAHKPPAGKQPAAPA
jgi:hypothetical protein